MGGGGGGSLLPLSDLLFRWLSDCFYLVGGFLLLVANDGVTFPLLRASCDVDKVASGVSAK